MDSILEWGKGILLFYLFLSFCSRMLPNEKYSRYTKMFLGMILCVMVLSKIMEFWGEKDSMQNNFFQYENRIAQQQMEEMMEKMEGEVMEAQQKEYENTATKSFANRVNQMGYYVAHMDYTWEEDRLVALEMIISEEENGSIYVEPIVITRQEYTTGQIEVINDIKNYAKQFYNVSAENILIEIQINGKG